KDKRLFLLIFLGMMVFLLKSIYPCFLSDEKKVLLEVYKKEGNNEIYKFLNFLPDKELNFFNISELEKSEAYSLFSIEIPNGPLGKYYFLTTENKEVLMIRGFEVEIVKGKILNYTE